MARSINAATIRKMNDSHSDEAFFTLIEIKHSDFTNVRLVNNTEDIVSDGSTYTAFPFSIILPVDNESAQPEFTVRVQNANLELVNEFRTIAGGSERVTCDIGVIALSDPDTLLAEWTDFELTDVQYNADVMTFTLSIDWLMSEAFPAASMTPNNFPGIF